MTQALPKKPRPLHFYTSFTGRTLCDRDNQRVRSTSNISTWDSPHISDGRRCEECRPGVEALRKARAQGVE